MALDSAREKLQGPNYDMTINLLAGCATAQEPLKQINGSGADLL